MGLKVSGGPGAEGTGAKETLKRLCGRAFTRAPNVGGAVQMLPGQTRAGVVMLLDGNVALRAVPVSAKTLDDFVFFFYRQVFQACSSAECVAVVFDEPDCKTLAKSEEEVQRDLKRKAREPVTGDVVVVGDDYDAAFLETHDAVRTLLDNRKARNRFIDEVLRRALERLEGDLARWRQRGYRTRLVVDGVDPAGAARPAGAPRIAVMAGDAELVEVLRRDAALGEGDLKLVDASYRIHAAAHAEAPAVAAVRFVCHVTVDTDAFALCLVSEERINRAFSPRRVRDLILFKEPAARGKTLEGLGQDDLRRASSVLMCDVSTLGQELRARAFPLRGDAASNATMQERERLVTLVAMAAALAGCDFMELKGANFDAALEAAFRLARQRGPADAELLSALDGMATKTRHELLALAPVVKRLCVHTAAVLDERAQYKAQARRVRAVDEIGLARTVWCASYWSLNEQKDVLAFGFPPLRG